jgi:hypothetical protein
MRYGSINPLELNYGGKIMPGISVKLRPEVPFKKLLDYGFFYWAGNNSYWFVLNKYSANATNVELSIQVDRDTRDVRLVATNDHIKLPSIYNKKYNATNYLSFEEELDPFSFEERIYPYMIMKMALEGLIYQPPFKGQIDPLDKDDDGELS